MMPWFACSKLPICCIFIIAIMLLIRPIRQPILIDKHIIRNPTLIHHRIVLILLTLPLVHIINKIPMMILLRTMMLPQLIIDHVIQE